jgi:hypothetical protein
VATTFQITFDASSPRMLSAFWATALGYRLDPPPPGHDSWESFLGSIDVPEERWDDASAISDPDGIGPRLFFQKVPEGKTAKNRVHLDVNAGHGITDSEERWRAVTERVQQLVAVGASIVEERRNDQFGDHWMVMADPDGNEFCVQ